MLLTKDDTPLLKCVIGYTTSLYLVMSPDKTPDEFPSFSIQNYGTKYLCDKVIFAPIDLNFRKRLN